MNDESLSDDEFAELLDAYRAAYLADQATEFWQTHAVRGEMRTRVETAHEGILAFNRLISKNREQVHLSYLLELGNDAKPQWSALKLGRFVLERELGRGGFGIVFLAHDPALKRSVAIKVPRLGSLGSAELQRRFRSEALIAAKLDHPNIVPVFEIGESAVGCYIVSLYCPGTTLAQWLKNTTNPLSITQAIDLFEHLVDAVAYCHSQGVLHRDLKPANILLFFGSYGSLPWHPRISDFGLAKVLDDGQIDGQNSVQLGTPNYMAPEQADPTLGSISGATDVYALGAIFYELLTGQPPHLSQSIVEAIDNLRNHSPMPPGLLNPDIPELLERIALKCVTRMPGDRYASAIELLDDLRNYRQGLPLHAALDVCPSTKVALPAVPDDLEAKAMLFVTSFDEQGRRMMDRCGDILSDDFTFFAPGDPKKLPFAGEFKGKQEFQRFLDAFHDFFTREPKKLVPTYYISDDGVIASYWEVVYYQGQKVDPIRVSLHMKFRDGLIVRVEDHFDHWAGMKALKAITKLKLKRFIQRLRRK